MQWDPPSWCILRPAEILWEVSDMLVIWQWMKTCWVLNEKKCPSLTVTPEKWIDEEKNISYV